MPPETLGNRLGGCPTDEPVSHPVPPHGMPRTGRPEITVVQAPGIMWPERAA